MVFIIIELPSTSISEPKFPPPSLPSFSSHLLLHLRFPPTFFNLSDLPPIPLSFLLGFSYNSANPNSDPLHFSIFFPMNPPSQPPHQIMHPPKRHLPLPSFRPPSIPSPGDYHLFSSSGRIPDQEADGALVVKSPVSLLWGSVCLGAWNWKFVCC